MIPWSIHRFPELERIEDSAQRREVWYAAYDPVLKRPTHWIFALFVQVGMQVLIGPLGLRSLRSIWIPTDGIRLSIQIAGAVLAVFLILWLMRRRIAKNLRLELTARGMPTCIACGYNLTGNTSGVCPECGTRA